MLIGLAGPSQAGKNSIIEYLKENHSFEQLYPQSYACLSDLVDYCTEQWQCNHVITELEKFKDISGLLKRPFFLLVSVDAPPLLRYGRFQKRLDCMKGLEQVQLKEFLHNDHHLMYAATAGSSTSELMRQSHIHLLNDGLDMEFLYQKLHHLQLTNMERLRPSWDSYFIMLCNLASQRSNCMKRRVGCLLVCSSRVIATGYNGTPRGIKNCNEGGCIRCNQNSSCGANLDACLCLHAEENAIIEAGRDRISSGRSVLYCNTSPVKFISSSAWDAPKRLFNVE